MLVLSYASNVLPPVTVTGWGSAYRRGELPGCRTAVAPHRQLTTGVNVSVPARHPHVLKAVAPPSPTVPLAGLIRTTAPSSGTATSPTPPSRREAADSAH